MPHNSLTMKNRFITYIKSLQNNITQSLEKEDGATTFREDSWKRPGGGGGKTRVIENGGVF